MVIGICDDENVIRDKIEKICINETKKYCEDVVIQKYSDGREVLEKDFDILILDIEMEDVDGIVVKNYFQKRKKDTIIIFVTSHNEMMSQAFGVNVMGFVAKKLFRQSVAGYVRRRNEKSNEYCKHRGG